MTHNLPSIRAAAEGFRRDKTNIPGGYVIVQRESADVFIGTFWAADPVAHRFDEGVYSVRHDGQVELAAKTPSGMSWEILEGPNVGSPPVHRFTTGPKPQDSAEFWELRRLIKADPDVHDVLELEPLENGRWLYLVRLPLEWVHPKYAVGTTDAKNEDVRILQECGAEWCAKDAWSTELRAQNIKSGDEG